MKCNDKSDYEYYGNYCQFKSFLFEKMTCIYNILCNFSFNFILKREITLKNIESWNSLFKTIFLLPRKICFKGWKLEYQDSLMTGHVKNAAGRKYTCVDSHPDTLHGGNTDKNGYLLYLARCGSLSCPPSTICRRENLPALFVLKI